MKKLCTILLVVLFFLAFRNSVFAGNADVSITIKGVVHDEDGKPLAGASVTEKGTTNGGPGTYNNMIVIKNSSTRKVDTTTIPAILKMQ